MTDNFIIKDVQAAMHRDDRCGISVKCYGLESRLDDVILSMGSPRRIEINGKEEIFSAPWPPENIINEKDGVTFHFRTFADWLNLCNLLNHLGCPIAPTLRKAVDPQIRDLELAVPKSDTIIPAGSTKVNLRYPDHKADTPVSPLYEISITGLSRQTAEAMSKQTGMLGGLSLGIQGEEGNFTLTLEVKKPDRLREFLGHLKNVGILFDDQQQILQRVKAAEQEARAAAGRAA